MIDTAALPGEGLRGLCLRSLPPDGPLRVAREFLRLTAKQEPASEDVELLSKMLGIDEGWAKERFCGHSRQAHSRWRFGRSPALVAHLRGAHAQVCVKCLRERRVLLFAWELALVTACPKHCVNLVDTCPHCSRPLSWGRPTVNICGCGHDITLAQTRRASLEAVDFAARLYQAASPELTGISHFGLLPKFMEDLSAPVMCSIVHAFGAFERVLQAPRPSDVTRRRGREQWESTIIRAVGRLQAVDVGMSVKGWVNDTVLLAQARIERRDPPRKLCLQLTSDESAQYLAGGGQGKLRWEDRS